MGPGLLASLPSLTKGLRFLSFFLIAVFYLCFYTKCLNFNFILEYN